MLNKIKQNKKTHLRSEANIKNSSSRTVEQLGAMIPY